MTSAMIFGMFVDTYYENDEEEDKLFYDVVEKIELIKGMKRYHLNTGYGTGFLIGYCIHKMSHVQYESYIEISEEGTHHGVEKGKKIMKKFIESNPMFKSYKLGLHMYMSLEK